MGFLMPPHPLTNFEIQNCYQNEPRFNGVYSRNILPKKIKVGGYVINLDEYEGIHWIALFCNRSEFFILIVLVLDMFLKKLKIFSGIKT